MSRSSCDGLMFIREFVDFWVRTFLEGWFGFKREDLNYSWKEKKRNKNIMISNLLTVTMNRSAKKKRKKRKEKEKSLRPMCLMIQNTQCFMIEYIEHKNIGLFYVLVVLRFLVWIVK